MMSCSSQSPRYAVLVLSTLLFAGCQSGATSGPDAGPRYAVTGRLTVDGETTKGVAINFIPQGATLGVGGFAITEENGTFKVVGNDQAAGIPAGDYFLTFSRRVMLDGSPIPPGSEVQGHDTKELLPRSLTVVQPERHPYLVTVNGPVDSLELDIKAKDKK